MRSRIWVVACLASCLAFAPAATAHEGEARPAVVIDTDMGLDDAVAVAMALQNPHIDVVGIVATEGVAGPEACALYLERMLHAFNRGDVPLYAGPETPSAPAPPFRPFAENTLSSALNDDAPRVRRSFSSDAYGIGGLNTQVLALGPLTSLATALQTDPQAANGIAEVVIPIAGYLDEAWNIRRDPDALRQVERSGIRVVPVDVRSARSIVAKALRAGFAGASGTERRRTTTPAAVFVDRLLQPESVRSHFLGRAAGHDELAVMYAAEPQLFHLLESGFVAVPVSAAAVDRGFAEMLREPRLHSDGVVLHWESIPASCWENDLAPHVESIIAKNGLHEWHAAILANEMHDHLGAYSLIGVKMAVRAAELLNAPRHGMRVISHTAPGPPVSCLNDGVMVASGSTVGRCLFEHRPGEPGATRVTFECRGRRLTLELKDEYRRRIRAGIQELLKQHTLEDDAYWAGVRVMAMDIWENWHRSELFEVVQSPAEGRSPTSRPVSEPASAPGRTAP